MPCKICCLSSCHRSLLHSSVTVTGALFRRSVHGSTPLYRGFNCKLLWVSYFFNQGIRLAFGLGATHRVDLPETNAYFVCKTPSQCCYTPSQSQFPTKVLTRHLTIPPAQSSSNLEIMAGNKGYKSISHRTLLFYHSHIHIEGILLFQLPMAGLLESLPVLAAFQP